MNNEKTKKFLDGKSDNYLVVSFENFNVSKEFLKIVQNVNCSVLVSYSSQEEEEFLQKNYPAMDRIKKDDDTKIISDANERMNKDKSKSKSKSKRKILYTNYYCSPCAMSTKHEIKESTYDCVQCGTKKHHK